MSQAQEADNLVPQCIEGGGMFHHRYPNRPQDNFDEPETAFAALAPPDGKSKPANSGATSSKHIRCSVRPNAAVPLSRRWDDVL
ncbi:hypothetical protein [Allomesorhizobium camelthorni]|uniref:Uncharacterized protein n=1 Tax=Allomesorhizobium camelthorni TaxID=475069 RepID=A0A6G4WHE6_9HYPH|nr:hypothetical protein [Mesorhizobium camelthorni]NGO54225.1 hypothetical protein [Mesorhizobium camelthorni]